MNREELTKNIIETDNKTKRLNVFGVLGIPGPMEMGILSKIKEMDGNVNVGWLAREMNTSLPNVSRALRAMEKDGKILRETDPNDRRNTVVNLTAMGEETLKENTDKLMTFFLSALERLTDQELEAYATVINSLYCAYSDELKNYK